MSRIKNILFSRWFFVAGILVLAFGVYSTYQGGQPKTAAEWNEVVIKEGRHWAWPVYWRWGQVDRQELRWRWDSTATYDLASADQHDWNKLTGESFHFWTNHRNSAMVAWRWNIDSSWIELAPYLHIDGQVQKAGWPALDPEPLIHLSADDYAAGINREIPIARARPGDHTSTFINLMQWERNGQTENAVAITIHTPMDTIFYEHPYGINIRRKTRKINPWFGGNRRAPQNIYFYYQIIDDGQN